MHFYNVNVMRGVQWLIRDGEDVCQVGLEQVFFLAVHGVKIDYDRRRPTKKSSTKCT